MNLKRILIVLCVVALFNCRAGAAVQLAQLFGDHMVMQRNVVVPVWGWADPGEQIAVVIDQQTKTTTADASGKWMVKLDPMDAGSPRKMEVKGKSETLEVNDILLGEVWICAGQSNMVWPVKGSKEPQNVAASANFPEIRLFEVGNGASTRPLDRMDTDAKNSPDRNARGRWNLCAPETVKAFSAVGYHFGRELHQQLKVPVGLIHNAVGATAIESWTSEKAMRADPDYKAIPEYFDYLAAWLDTPAGKAAYDANAAKYEKNQQALKNAGKPFKWPRDYRPRTRESFLSTYFNSRVNPLIPYAIRGVIWYQGEAQTWAGKFDPRMEIPIDYRGQLPLMINDWRSQWGQGDFPFLIAQLATYGKPQPEPINERGWSIVREAQQKALSLPNTGLAVTIDIGEGTNIHPGNKQDVGHRLALVARAKVYGEPIVYSGPVYRDMKIEGAAIRLYFDHVGGGLMVGKKDGLAPVTEDTEGKLQRFAIAGEDKKWVWADAVIDKNTVVVSSPEVHQPVAVRYAWESAPEPCKLYNREGLPSSSFRTDEEPTFVKAAVYKAKLKEPASLVPVE